MSVRSIPLSMLPNAQTKGSYVKAKPSAEKCSNLFLCRVCYQKITDPHPNFLQNLLCNVHGEEFEAIPKKSLGRKIKELKKKKMKRTSLWRKKPD